MEVGIVRGGSSVEGGPSGICAATACTEPLGIWLLKTGFPSLPGGSSLQ